MWTSAIGLVEIIAPAVFGSVFLTSQNDIYTFIMAIFAAVAQIAYAYAIVRAHHISGQS